MIRNRISQLCLLSIFLAPWAGAEAEETDPVLEQAPQETPHLLRQEKKLDRLEASRERDTQHRLQAQAEYLKGSTEMTGHAEQQEQDIRKLRSVEGQVTAGKNQKKLDHASYDKSVHEFGSNDPRSAAAKQNWKESRQALDPLLQSRKTLKENVHDGGRLVHNEKTVLSVQKRTMESDARYRASDDRKITKVKEKIADDREASVPHP